MRKQIIFLMLLMIGVGGFSQTEPRPIVEEHSQKMDYQKFIQIFSDIDPNSIVTGFLSDKSTQLVSFNDYDGSDKAKTITYFRWKQLYDQVRSSQVRSENKLLSLDSIYYSFSKKPIAIKQYGAEDPLMNVRENVCNEEFVPIAVIDVDYNSIRKDAFDKDLLRVDNQKIKEGSNVGESPYETKKLFAASALKNKIYQGHSVKFLFDNAFYFSNKDGHNQQYTIDFGDGLGLRNIDFGQTIDVSYSSIGKKTIKLMKTEQGTMPGSSAVEQLIASFSIGIEALTVPNYTFKIPLNITIPVNYPHGGENVKGSGYVYTSDGSQNIRNPIIICEGFDPLNERGWNELYTLLNRQNFIECMKANGYDFIVLNFTDGSTYIERNAYLLKELIENINARKVTQNKLIVVGASMGGLVSRYALAYMEQHGINHDTRLFVSFDSPQKGANVPLGAQYWLKFFADMSEVVKDKYDNMLCSIAARQMLVYHSEYSPDPTDNPYRTAFLQNLNSLGYPSNLRKIAIANGAGNAYGQRKNDGTAFCPGDQIINWYYRNFWTVDIDGNSWAVPNVSPSTTIFYGDIERSWLAHLYQWNFSDDTLTINIEGTYPYDNAPGGTSDATQTIADGDTGGLGDITTDISNHCFIPTVSSLAINTTNLFYNIASDPDILSKTPFDAIYYPINDNQEHVYISEPCVNWFRNELVPQNVVLDGVNDSWNVGEVRAGNSISLMPGFHTVSGKNFHAHIAPLQSCSRAPMTNSEDVSNEHYSETNQMDMVAGMEVGNNNEALASVFPNPTDGKFHIRISNAEQIECVEVFNVQGTLVYRNNSVRDNDLVDITDYPNGMYFVKLVINGKIQTTKIVKN